MPLAAASCARRRTRVAVAERHRAIRRCIRSALAGVDDIEVVAEAATRREIAAVARALRPDVVVMDCSTALPADVSPSAFTAGDAGMRILLLIGPDDGDPGAAMQSLGAAAWLSKSDSNEQLVAAVRALAREQDSSRHLRRGAPSPSAERERFETLASREREVFALLAYGYTAPEIGVQLGISAKTVYSYKARIAEKVGVSHRSQYVQAALRMGLLNVIPRGQVEPRPLPGAHPAPR